MKSGVRKPSIAMTKTVSKAHKFQYMTSQKTRDLKQIKLKQRMYSKLNWAVNVYKEWCEFRLENVYNEAIFNANFM